MFNKSFFFSIIVLAGALITSCTKPDEVKDPEIVLKPAATSGIAGSPISISYTMIAPNGIKSFKIEEQFENNPKTTLKDSTLATSPSLEDLNYNYHIPDSAAKDQKSVLTFTLTDGKGKTSTKQTTITATGSRPRVTVSQNVTAAHSGDSVIFSITLKSVEANLDSLKISENVKNAGYTKIAGFSYSGQSSANTTYIYHVPKGLSVGDQIYVDFTVTNKSGVNNFISKNVSVN